MYVVYSFPSHTILLYVVYCFSSYTVSLYVVYCFPSHTVSLLLLLHLCISFFKLPPNVFLKKTKGLLGTSSISLEGRGMLLFSPVMA